MDFTQQLVGNLKERKCRLLLLRLKVLYMSSSFWLLQVESRHFSQAEKERFACKAEQSHKTTTIFTQNDKNSNHFVNILSFASSSFFLSMRKSRDQTPNCQKLEDM